MSVENDSHRKTDSPYTRKVLTAVGIGLLLLIVLYIFKAAFNVVLLILAGALIAVYFRGFALWLSERTVLSEKAAVWIVVGGTILVIALTTWLIGARISEQLTQLVEQIPRSAEEARELISQYDFGKKILDNSEKIRDNVPSGNKIMQHVGRFFQTTFGVVGDLYVIILIGIFFSAQPYIYRDSILSLIPKSKLRRGEAVLSRLGLTLRDWLLGKIAAMIFVAVLTAIGLLIAGVPMALALALIAGILNFIPNFGPLIALIPALLVAIPQGTGTILFVAALYVGIQLIESSFITPLIQKRLIQIPPAFIIIGQITMGVLTGGLGIILATPLVAIIMVLTKELYVKDALDKNPGS